MAKGIMYIDGQGCGLCVATCPQGAIQLSHSTDNQILAEVNALCRF